MELKAEIGFDQLLQAIKQMPENQRAILKQRLDKKIPKVVVTDFQKVLLNGPVRSDEHYEAYKEIRKRFKKWRIKQYC